MSLVRSLGRRFFREAWSEIGGVNQESDRQSTSVKESDHLAMSTAAANLAMQIERPSVSVSVQLPMVLAQYGHVCKPTALANLDWFHASKHQVPNVPLRKNQHGQFSNQLNEWVSGQAASSVRQLAKQCGSVQGEVLQVSQLRAIATRMGYLVQIHRPESTQAFGRLLQESLEQGLPVLVPYAMNTAKTAFSLFGYPGDLLADESNEHAGVVVGVNLKNGTVDLAHQGNVFRMVPIAQLYESMNTLPTTRQQEFYGKASNPGRAHLYQKYNRIRGQNLELTMQVGVQKNSVKRSLIPDEGSGFKNTVIILQPDQTHPRWSK